jgi:hypothetical protein
MMLGRSALALASRSARKATSDFSRKTAATRNYTVTTPLSDLSKYYFVEVSNADRADATRITVRGPDVDGILASMTVALAQQGCSLKELHAGFAHNETISFEKHVEGDQIEDIFYVAQHSTGKQFPDEALHDLGSSLLKSLKNPMTCLSGKSAEEDLDLDKDHSKIEQGEQIKVVKKGT